MSRIRVINFLKNHPKALSFVWAVGRLGLKVISVFISPKSNKMLFVSFGGRKFDDSPKALYDEISKRESFKGWDLVWGFVNPEEHKVNIGRKVRIDTPRYFYELLSSKVWIDNSGAIDRGVGLKNNKRVVINTWHGTPLKKIGGDEHSGAMATKKKGKVDAATIRCAQSEYDREIFQRIFNASKESFILCDLPRNDELLNYSKKEIQDIRSSINIPVGKKIILYTPTYREYLMTSSYGLYIAPPITLNKWKEQLGGEYVLLMRAHYAVTEALDIKEDDFIKDVSNYPSLNDLYVIADLMISDYSSTYFDYSILDRPMYCFAYDYEEYIEKRGLYLKLEDVLPCNINYNEDDLLGEIIISNKDEYSLKTKKFHERFAPYAGNASQTIITELEVRLSIK